MLFLPEGTAEQMAWYDELQRRSTSAETAARLYDARGGIDVVEVAPRVTDSDAGRARARRPGRARSTRAGCSGRCIPGARLVLLESANHILLSDEPAWPALPRGAARVPRHGPGRRPAPSIEDLSPRELEVLELVAEGLTNEEIARRLSLSVRTVERHLSNVYAKLRVSGKAARAAAAASSRAATGRPAIPGDPAGRAACRPPRRRRGCVLAPMPARPGSPYRGGGP